MLMMMEVSVTSVLLILGIFCSASWAQPGLHCFYCSYYHFQGGIDDGEIPPQNDSGLFSPAPPPCVLPQCGGFLVKDHLKVFVTPKR